MDVVTSISQAGRLDEHGTPRADDVEFDAVSMLASMPPEAPLDMPVQSLSLFDRKTRHMPVPGGQRGRVRAAVWAARLFVFGGGLLLTAYGAREMYGVINVGTITLLKWALLVLFLINFSWIALSFMSGTLGALWMLFNRRREPDVSMPLKARTAVVMPIYNEAPTRLLAAMQAMIEEVHATGHGGHFDWFLLSDTTDPNIWIAEEQAFVELRKRIGHIANVHYRHRPKNTARKAGNIGDFVSRWGGAYEHMLVLDADSLMSAPAIVALAAAMENDPDAGIIQTLPLIINRNTFFARLQQFAARIYGPVIAAGLAIWSGRDGNYWGHNAIIRMRAFADHCGLPHLRGRPPFGGHILSHDFIEAAMIRRAGYSVYMLPDLGGSYEESPPSLIDVAARDRRWCQGNLQHSRIIAAKGLKLVTRQHLASGIMSYLASPLWFAQLLVGITLVLQSAYIRPEYFTDQFTLFPAWPVFDAKRALQLFIVTMGVLLAPKAYGIVLAILDAPTRRGAGGVIRLLLSSIIEVFMSALVAPIMMVIQTGSVFRILSGRDTGWNPQRRDDGSIAFGAIVRRHWSHVLLGIVTLIAGFIISPSLVAWMSPTIGGLILAIVISWASGQLWLGLALRRVGLLQIPEEAQQPPIAARAIALQRELGHGDEAPRDALLALHGDTHFRRIHEHFLPGLPARERGHVDAARAVAEAKLNDAHCIQEAAAWLGPQERMVVLHDRALIDLVARLPAACPETEAARAA